MQTFILLSANHSVLYSPWLYITVCFFAICFIIFLTIKRTPYPEEQRKKEDETIQQQVHAAVELTFSEIKTSIDAIRKRFKAGITPADLEEIKKQADMLQNRLSRLTDSKFCSLTDEQTVVHEGLLADVGKIEDTIFSLEKQIQGAPPSHLFPFEVNLITQ